MKKYLFYDNVSGEMFIVETDMKEKAYLCAYKYFEDPIFEVKSHILKPKC